MSASAQTIPIENKKESGPSHIELPLHAGANSRFADFLKSRDHAREAAESYKEIQKLLQTLNKEQKDKLPKKLFDKNGELMPGAELNEEELQTLKDQLKEFLQNSYQSGGGGGLSQETVETLKKFEETKAQYRPQEPPPGPDRTRDRTDASGENNPNTGPPTQPIPPAPERTTEQKKDALQNGWVEWFRKGPLGNSPTLRDLGRRLSQPMGGSQGSETPDGLAQRLERLGETDGFKNFVSRLPKFSRSNSSSFAPASAPSLGSFDRTDPRTFRTILVVCLVVVMIVLAWKLLKDRRTALDADGRAAWRLGPWPVDPAQINTREELIRAFEYLSLLRFGRPARSWNHRAIARRLGDQSQQAAEHLAGLYEKARYAPPADPLPEDELREARRDLCLLAGVAHA
jgi:hypothetical protein